MHLLSRRVLARNSVINLIGQGLPIIFGLIAIPLIVKGFGTDRFGLLALAWAVIGYFSLFDLGLGRAITQVVAEKLGRSEIQEIPRLVWTGLAMMGAFGVIGAAVAAAASPRLAYSVLKIPPSLKEEAMWSFFMLSASLPFVIISAGLAGLLTAFQRFGLINALRIPSSISTYLVTIGVMVYSKSLFHVCAALVVSRALFTLLYFVACFRVFPLLGDDIKVDRTEIRQLMRFGGWMTVTNVLGPLMTYMDRFVIGAYLSTTAVVFYATPYEIVTKLFIVPGAIVVSLFPAFAIAKGIGLSRASELYSMGARLILLLLAPIVLGLVVFAREALQIWLGADFSRNSAVVLQCLAVGVYLNSLAQVPYVLIQGLGRPDWTAKLHMIELPLYAVLLVWLLGRFGVEGAAVAWLGRVALDGIALFFIAHRMLPGLMAATFQKIVPMLVVPMALFLFGATLNGLTVKLTFFFLATFVIIATAYFLSSSQSERQSLTTSLRSFFG